MNSLKWKERKGGKKRRERRGSERERDEESMRERDRWGSEWLRERGRLLNRERETDVPKLYAYNECEHSVMTSCS